ncbi:MAG: CHAT domain-containing protein [Arthrospira sp. PLM2.Bin9]|nr:CHAT domain-containing tetratricopeptide repeat protein [Arthrospira sp. PLM2.Bin9]TVU55421.1 MAG: CHAT domain-containing protein [Arthrospira sp. PLM2.Bin9]
MPLKNISSCLFLIAFMTLGKIEFIKFLWFPVTGLPVLAQERGEDLVIEAIQLHEIGDKQVAGGELKEALITFDRALHKVRVEGDRQLEALILNDIGVVYRNLGNYPQAGHFLNEALTIRQNLNDRQGISQTLINLGALSSSQANYPQAINFYEQALAVLPAEESYGSAVIFNNMGQIYRALGQPQKALIYFQQAGAIFAQEDDDFAVGITLANMGAVYHAMGDYSQALEFYGKGLAIASEIGDAVGVGQTLLNMGAAYEKLANYSQALQLYNQGLEIMRAIGEEDAQSQALNNIGSVHRLMGDYSQAIEFYDRALEIRRNLRNTAGIAVTLNNKGVALFEAGKIAEATQTLYAAIDALESLRPGLSDANKVSIFDKYRSSYSILQKALISENKPEIALEIAERGRARAFLELIAQQLSPEAVQEYDRQNNPPMRISDIQKVAGQQNATLVQYSIISDNFGNNSALFIWVVQPTGNITFREVNLSQLETFRETLVPFLAEGTDSEAEGLLTALVRGTRQGITETLPSISTRNLRNSHLQQLHDLLIKPIADLLPQNPEDKVIFIPHQELLFVPFPALIDESDRYLIFNHTILTAPAIQVLQLTRQLAENRRINRTNNPANALVVGNPVMPKLSIEPGEEPKRLANLPGAEAEAIAIASMLNTEALIGSAATKSEVLERINSAAIVHLATHGLLDDFSESGGVLGAIALTPSYGDRGFLTSEEIMGLNLTASLVVLSACNTGGGRITGDGIIGLSRAFIGAGAESVIVSLWQAEDAPTAKLMQEFYRLLPQKGDRAVALRQAMLTTMEEYPQPKHWAAFTLMGESLK